MEWNSITKEQCKKLIDSCASRCEVVIENKGLFAKYYSICQINFVILYINVFFSKCSLTFDQPQFRLFRV